MASAAASAAPAAPVFNPRLVVGLIVAGILGFAALMLLLAFGDRIGSSRTGRANALSVSAVGYKGLVDLTSRVRPAFLVRNEADMERATLLVVALEPQSRPETLRRLLEARAGSPVLIILPKWVTEADPEHRGWVRALFPGATSPAIAAIEPRFQLHSESGPGGQPQRAYGGGRLAGLSLFVPGRYQSVIGGKGITPLAALPDGQALVAQLGDEPHYLLADPDLVANHALRDPERARAALELLTRLDLAGATPAIGFDLTVNGYGSGEGRSMLRTAFEPPFLAMTLALFVAALLAGLHGAFRFGPTAREQRAIAFGKSALVENSAGLIRLAGREARLGTAYADVMRQETARATAAPAHLQGEALDVYLNRLGKDGPTFSELAANLAAAQSRNTLMAAVRRAWAWRKTVVR